MTEKITLAGGCFWCIEAILIRLKGVESAVSGYSGGDTKNPTYESLHRGDDGHAEAVQITFNPEVISLHDLLTIFMTLHDPTTLNRQGADIGPEYRSAIFYSDANQREIAQTVLEEIDAQGIWPDPIVTALEPFEAFYPAEDYHQEFYEKNTNSPYCQIVIAPKVAKLRKEFFDRLKAE